MAFKLELFKFFLLQIIVIAFSNCKKENDLTGFILSPETVDDRFEQSQIWNASHPFKNLIVNVDNYRILAAADSHIGGTTNFNVFLTEAKKPENLAFVMDGDIVTGPQDDYSTFQQLLPNFDEKPYFLLIGNHDLFFDGWKTFYTDFGTSTYWFTVQTPIANDIYICLDSGSGTLGDKQLAWLKNTLSTQRNKYRNCIVFSHVNFFRNRHAGSSSFLVPELYVLLDLFARNNVNMVISGHDHAKALNVLGNTTYIIIGALRDYYPNAGYLKLSITDGKIGYGFSDIR
jgi:UDP-2,3-diacylglucosamine pyrophosphatase LpxH